MEIASVYGEKRAQTQGGNVFMTEAKIDEVPVGSAVQMRQAEHAQRGKTSPRGNEFSQLMALEGGTTAQTSYFESKLTA